MQSETKWRVTSTHRRSKTNKMQKKKTPFLWHTKKKSKEKKRKGYENILKTGAKLIKLMLGFLGQ